MKEFIIKMLSSNDDEASKRVNGTACIMVVIVILVVSLVFKIDIKSELWNLIDTVFWGGVVLLGVGIGDRIMKV